MRWSRAASETARPRPQQEPAARWSDLVLPDLDAEALSPAPIRRAAAVGIPWLSDSATKRTSGLSPFVPSRERRHCPRALLLADRKAAAPAELPAGAEIPHKAPLRLRYRICQVNGAVRRARCRTPRACPQQQSAQGRLGGVRLDASGVCCSAGCTDGSRTVALLARRGRRVDRRCPRRFPVR